MALTSQQKFLATFLPIATLSLLIGGTIAHLSVPILVLSSAAYVWVGAWVWVRLRSPVPTSARKQFWTFFKLGLVFIFAAIYEFAQFLTAGRNWTDILIAALQMLLGAYLTFLAFKVRNRPVELR